MQVILRIAMDGSDQIDGDHQASEEPQAPQQRANSHPGESQRVCHHQCPRRIAHQEDALFQAYGMFDLHDRVAIIRIRVVHELLARCPVRHEVAHAGEINRKWQNTKIHSDKCKSDSRYRGNHDVCEINPAGFGRRKAMMINRTHWLCSAAILSPQPLYIYLSPYLYLYNSYTS